MRHDFNKLNRLPPYVLAEVIAQMSHWEPSSQLSRINAAAPGGWHGIAPEFVQVMTVALDIATRSDGAFDPAMGALVDLWGFGPPGPRPLDAFGKGHTVPFEDEIAAETLAKGCHLRVDRLEQPLLAGGVEGGGVCGQ